MRFSVATVIAFAASALAQTPNFDAITKPGQSETVAAGSSFTLNWQPSAAYPGTVSIYLLGGATPGTLDVISTLAKGVDNAAGTFTWPVDASLGSLATYGIRINLDSDPSIFQYSFPFAIKAGQAVSSSSSSTVVSTSASVSTSSSAAVSTSATESVTTITAAVTFTTSCTTSAVVPQSTPLGNSTIPTSSSPSISTIPSRTPSVVPVSGAKSVAVGSFTLFGALAVAFFAL